MSFLKTSGHVKLNLTKQSMTSKCTEPGLLDELARRVEEAEKKFQAADLDLRLKELDAAKQRQVK